MHPKKRKGPRAPISTPAMLAVVAVLVLIAPSRVYCADFVAQWAGSRHDWAFAIAQRGQESWAAGSFGLMVGQRGASWSPVKATAPLSLLGLAFDPNGSGVAAGQLGLLLEVPPDSKEWSRHDVGTKNRLFSVAASPVGEFLVSGAFGTLLDRPAGNPNWHPVELGFTGLSIPNLYAVRFIDSHKIIVAGENGALVTIDSGKITNKILTEKESLFALSVCAGMIVAGGQTGVIQTSEDGIVWLESRIPGNPDIYGLGCMSDGRLVASSSWLLVIGTRQGTSWSWRPYRPPGDIPWFQAVVPSQDGSALVSGQGGIWEVRLSNGSN